MAYTGSLNEKLERHGLGTYVYKNNSFKYEGNYQRGVKNGKGKFFVCGSFIEGEFKANEITGFGKKTWDSGATYEGDFNQGEFNGFGTMTKVTGEIYKGNFSNNKRDGEGELISPDGKVYQGLFKDHKRNGAGTEYLRNGAVFVGTWLNNLRQGPASLSFATNEVFKATWYENEIDNVQEAIFVDKTFSYTGAWNSNVPTESPKSTDFEITPKGTAISAAEIEEEENQDNTNNTNNTDNKDNNKWVCELSNGERISDWTFNIPTTKQVDKKTRIIPEKGRTIQVTTWLMKPALTEEEEAAAQELIATQEAAVQAAKDNEEEIPSFEPPVAFVPIQTKLFVVVPKENEEEAASLNGGDSAIVEVDADENVPTVIAMEINEKGVACLPEVDVNVDTVPGKYKIVIQDITLFGKGSLEMGFGACEGCSIVVEIGAGGGGSKAKGKKKKKK